MVLPRGTRPNMAAGDDAARAKEARARAKALFWKSGNIKVAAVAAVAVFPILGLWYFNYHLSVWARPKVLQLREYILGRPDYENADLRRGLGMQSEVHPSTRDNIFLHSRVKVPSERDQ